MSERKKIHGATMRFSDEEIRILIEVFKCKTMDDLSQAAQRYERLFFMFDHETHGVEMYPGEDFRMVLALAEHVVFDNFTQTNQPLQRRYFEKPKPKRGRSRKEPLPDNILEKFEEARKVVSTNEAAAQRLMALGTLKPGQKPRTAKTMLRYIQQAEKEREQAKEEEFQRYLEACEAFKDFAPEPPDEARQHPADE